MPKPNYKAITIVLGLVVLSSLFAWYILAWSEPLQSPPGCDPGYPGCDAPLNVGDTEQVKEGKLGIAIPLPAEWLDLNYGLTVGTSANPLGIKTSGISFFESPLATVTLGTGIGTDPAVDITSSSIFGLRIINTDPAQYGLFVAQGKTYLRDIDSGSSTEYLCTTGTAPGGGGEIQKCAAAPAGAGQWTWGGYIKLFTTIAEAESLWTTHGTLTNVYDCLDTPHRSGSCDIPAGASEIILCDIPEYTLLPGWEIKDDADLIQMPISEDPQRKHFLVTIAGPVTVTSNLFGSIPAQKPICYYSPDLGTTVYAGLPPDLIWSGPIEIDPIMSGAYHVFPPSAWSQPIGLTSHGKLGACNQGALCLDMSTKHLRFHFRFEYNPGDPFWGIDPFMTGDAIYTWWYR